MEAPAQAIAGLTAAPVALAAQSILSVASFAAQSLADVALKVGSKPLSLILISVAESGERKSSCDKLALRGLRAFETDLDQQSQIACAKYKDDKNIYDSQRRAILSGREDAAERRNDLEQLTEPKPPLAAQLILTDPTIEGLYKHFEVAHPSLAIFSDEGGQFIGGHGMSEDNKLETGAAISVLWDGGDANRTRAGSDRSMTYRGRRVCCHLMIQPLIAEGFLGDKALRSQGLLSRMLVAYPESRIGTRLEDPNRSSREDQTYFDTLEQFQALIKERLELGFMDHQRELSPRGLPLSADAQALYIHFYNKIERAQAKGGTCANITGFASKLAEQAARLAGILQIIANPGADDISAEMMNNGITLAEWYLSEALRLFDNSVVPEDLSQAETLRQWLQKKWQEPFIDCRTLQQRGPNALRTKALIQKLVRILVDHNWLVPESTPQRVNGARSSTCWRVVRE